MATIKDVAKDAGVSVGTVSKVLNGIYVSDKYRKKVEDSIERLQFQVNLNARGLKATHTNDIAVIVPTVMNALFPPMIDSIEQELTRRGKRMHLCISRNDADKIDDFMSVAQTSRIDGVFGVPYSKIKDPALAGIPYVSFDRHFGPDIPCVACDNEAGGYLAAKTLHEKGSRNLLCFWAGTDYESEPRKRIDGFLRYCREYQVENNVVSFMDYNQADTGFMYPSEYYRKLISRCLKDQMKHGKLPYDGIFASSDHQAYLIKHELMDMGLRIPEDVQIIGFDGMPDFVTGKPVVSSIRQPIEEIAACGVSLLLDMIDGKEVSSVLDLPVSFAEGNTTRK